MPYEIIKKAGFEYDSSLHPTWVLGFYFNLFAKRKPYVEKGLKIIPITVVPFFRIPISWFWFNLYPLWLTKIFTKFCLIGQNEINIFFHGWEFNKINKLEKLENYIKFFKEIQNI